MLNLYFLIEAFLPEFPILSQQKRKQIAYDCKFFVAKEFATATFWIRLGIYSYYFELMLLLFFLNKGKSFKKTTVERRNELVNVAVKKFPPNYMFIRMIRTLAFLFFMEYPEVALAIEQHD